ncbi:efflux RND transporter periplasmic adaptor subunit [Pseudomonas typographi]|uniref:efflux RND transporter periplasmic adaptor subunit n=1 Tax=Pseudomonas typographi TaxID=2715964 RepID=UPI001682A4D0|nr:efflux RND transporter periplasmic adaptor subunit [Pseudomonas typographi]MBD1550017.1 efflux RND transporter periplasmic adaptor subunit [Pseudomonas typographi]
MARVVSKGAAWLLAGLLAGCGEEKAAEPDTPRVQVLQVQPVAFNADVQLTGDIRARVQTELSFRVSGKITQRTVDVGDHVNARQVLARLDPKDLQTNVDSANAAMFAEQARLVQAQAAFERQAKLLPKGYTSRSEYDAAQAQLRASQSSLAAAQAQLANAREQRSYADLAAEAPGIITARQAEVGQVVQATVPIFDLARDGERDAVFNVYDGLLAQAPPDQQVTVSLLDDPSVSTTGTVREITPAVSAQTGTLQVKVALHDLPAGMRLGSVVGGSIQVPATPAVELPWAALTKDLHDPAVWLVQGGQVSLRKVAVARYLTGKVIVSDGLKAGDQVVTAGGQLLHPGMRVEVAQERSP